MGLCGEWVEKWGLVAFSVSPTLGNSARQRVTTGWEKEVVKDL